MKLFFLTIIFQLLALTALKSQTSVNLNTVSDVDSVGAIQTKDSLLLQKNIGLQNKEDVVGILVKMFKVKNIEEKRLGRKTRFSLFPTSSSITGDKMVLTSVNFSFLLGDISTTKVSNIYFLPYIGFNHQFGFQMQPNIWTKNNSWNFTGEYFILNYPQYTWGPGGNSPDENKTMVDYDHLRIHQNVLKGILPDFSVGLGYSFDRHYNIQVQESDSSALISRYLPPDEHTSTSSGIVLPILYDSRKNLVNPQQGMVASFSYSIFDPVLGSDDKWQSVYFDVRKYFPFEAKTYRILALRSYYWTIVKGDPPYLDLPANRWEPISGSASRGIKQNRYRSNAILYFESEYRFGISANGLWGGVVFASITAPSEYNTQHFIYWHPAAGAGVRLKFNKYSNTNVTCDAGFSKGFFGVYVNIGEAF
jgi:hypothetical protein